MARPSAMQAQVGRPRALPVTRSVSVSLLLVLAAVLGPWLSACAPATPEPIDRQHIEGRWEFTNGSETEWFDFKADGRFEATVQQDGFMAQTLSQSTPVKLEGRWQLQGSTMTLDIEHTSDPALDVLSHRCEVLELTSASMVTRDADGTTKTLHKAL